MSVVLLLSGTCVENGTPLAGWVFTYDGDGTRVKQVYTDGSSTLTTYYFFGGAYEVQDDGMTGTVRKYYAFAGQTIAMTTCMGGTCSAPDYFLTDHLGSVVAVTDEGGALLSEQRYLPFGQVRTDVGFISETDFGYTGQRNLDAQGNAASLGLMDYNARLYDPRIMQFQQPDTLIPEPYNPQSWNRYTYANNNPILYTDPSGHCGMAAHYNILYGVFNIIPYVQACIKSISRVVEDVKSGVTDAGKLAADATGFTDWAIGTGARVDQLNAHVATVFSNAPIAERLPASVDVGWFTVSTAANIVGTAQLARGALAFTRNGEFGPYAVDGTQSSRTFGPGDNAYRVYGGTSQLERPWLFTENPGNQITAIRGGALPPGNSATLISNVGFTGFVDGEVSTTAGMFGQPGGFQQILLSGLGNVTFSPASSLPIGIMPAGVPTNISRIFHSIFVR